jgi:hypothetical protein
VSEPTKAPKLLAQIEGENGRSIGLFESDYRHELIIGVIDQEDEATAVTLPMGMVNALAEQLVSWVEEAVHKKPESKT